MDSELYQYFFATEFVDMFPQTNGDIFATVYISLDRFPKTDINLDVSCHVETVCLLSQLKQK